MLAPASECKVKTKKLRERRRKDYHHKQFKTPKETMLGMRVAAKLKGDMRWDRLLILGFLSGAYIAMGGLFSLTVGGALPLSLSDPGRPAVYNTTDSGEEVLVAAAQPPRQSIQKLLMGACFPVGLMLVVVSGTELWTGNVMYMLVGLMGGTANLYHLCRNWFWSLVGNFIGSIFFAGALVYGAGLFDDEPYLSFVQLIAYKKTQVFEWHELFLRAIGCNWLVCLALWLAMASEDVISKIFSIWFVIMLFVAVQFEHCVANMFFIPLGVFYYSGGSVPETTFSDMFRGNLVPVTLGNLVGGGLFVAALQTWCYGWGWVDVYGSKLRKFCLGHTVGRLYRPSWPSWLVRFTGAKEYGPHASPSSDSSESV
mmetsp:Transcript_11568/g.29163  ORF Transcript_11568/g.29163 Transcript_11568/m.29163 type:complete len:369 (-) Transcript_11568:225-1331(-)|eukprot:CAMPEP_0177656570 /NCGR_PEP_ID=MMETSP0447-20121125/15649_1 /TAXON_ID=0 /ORGANISM="Stygamoeba regulata, Strain BSH-02190019" /LENGTH=368 /DNA_ID=CAMNT_0019160721 /DNA_START=168 /DNA_END=1274 /DNA_ORIENTATION=+